MFNLQTWTKQRILLLCGLLVIFLILEYQFTASENKRLQEKASRLQDDLDKYKKALDFATIESSDPDKLDLSVAQLEDPLLVIGTRTNPPFFITIFNPVEDAFISKVLLEKGIHGDSILIENTLKETLLNHQGSKPPLFLDLGANVGLHSLQAAAYGYRVILFEPNPKCLHRIKTSIHLNNFQDRITINPFAVGAEPGTAVLSISHNSPGMSTLGKNQEELDKLGVEIGGESYEVKVDIVRVDDYVKEKVDMMKVDVEGFELFAMKGAKQLLTKYEVPWIHMEIFPRILKGANTQPLTLLRYMHREMGYDMYYKGQRIPDDGYEKFIIDCGEVHRDVVWKKRT